MRQNVTKKAQETEETPQQIIGQELQNLSEGASIQMVPIRHIRCQIRRKRQLVNALEFLIRDS